MSIIYVVATPIGNISDISERAIKAIKSSHIIAAEDTRNTKNLLNHFGITTCLTSYHKFNEIEKSKELIETLLDKDLILSIVSDAGTPCISDPGAKIVSCAREKGIKVVPIPGPCAAIAALSISGFEIKEFSFYGFLERKDSAQIKSLNSIRNNSKIAIIYESPKRIKQLVLNISLVDSGALICLCNDITKYYEFTIVGSTNEILHYLESNEKSDKGEYCIVVKWSEKITKDSLDEKLSTEAVIFDLVLKGYTKEEIFERLQKIGYKRNQLYKAFEYVKSFNYNK